LTADLRAFTGLLFRPDHYVLVEAVQERRAGVVRPRNLARRWWRPADLVENAPRMIPWALERQAAVYFGVLPRRLGVHAGMGALPGRVVWADLDNDEAKARLAAWRPASVVVSTGRGLHAYWILDRPQEPGRLVAATARIGGHIVGDRVWDLARVLRLPGSWWVKADPPRKVEIVTWEPSRIWTLAELVGDLPVAHTAAGSGRRIDTSEVAPPPSWLLTRIEGDPKLRAYWSGEAGGQSRSERDFKLVLALAVRGFRDRRALASVLLARPDGAAHHRRDPDDYLGRTIERALTLAAGWRRR